MSKQAGQCNVRWRVGAPVLGLVLAVGVAATTHAQDVGAIPLPSCSDALECIQAVDSSLICPGEDTNPNVLKLRKLVDKKLAKAEKFLLNAGGGSKAKKAEKLVKKGRKQLAKLRPKVEKLASKGKSPISPECRDSLLTTIDTAVVAIDEARLGVTLPTGGGGGGSGKCKGSRTMVAQIGGKRFKDSFTFHEPIFNQAIIQGCDTFPGRPECEQALVLNVVHPGGSGGFTTNCGLFGLPSISFTDSVGGGIQNVRWESTSCTITVKGDQNGKLTGTFSGTLRRFTDTGEEQFVEIAGCFASKPL